MKRLLVLAAAALSCVAPGAAQADTTALSGSLTMTSDPGDWVGAGASYAYATPESSFRLRGDARFYDGNYVRVSLTGPGGDWWYLNFQAPTGQRLTPGVTYDGAIRGIQSAPPPGPSPRMDVYGNGRGCNTLTGSFTVHDVVYGPYGYLQDLHLSFEQHCEGAEAALRGEVDVTGPAGPPAQAVAVTIDPSGTAQRPGGAAVVHGTISCAVPTEAWFNVSATQQTRKGTASGWASVAVANCGPAPEPWSATLRSTDVPFAAGTAQVHAAASLFDAWYTQYLAHNPIYATGDASSDVALRLPR
ncbi:MAG: hypothetical protein M3321_05475 [Actinomycetota bacterium]|nr:hypothetical protein [Actinomycetota bacterium]